MTDPLARVIAVLTTTLRFVERRSTPASADYFEAVLHSQDLERCCAVLGEILGPPVKPFGARPSLDADLHAALKTIGDVRANQCLFFLREGSGRATYAMLWPWGSNARRVTLKAGRVALQGGGATSA